MAGRQNIVGYPVPSATHDQVFEDRELFQRTHVELLHHIGVKLKIPKVGGIEVDLHQLYKEVTQLGGIENVINRKQWVIVCNPFHFPSSFTNKSFVVKKLYVNTMHHYEQVYFHRTRGPLVSAPTGASDNGPCMPKPSSAPLPVGERALKRKPEDNSESLLHSVTIVPANSGSPGGAPLVTPDLPPGTPFTGIIDSNFDLGYMITLNLPNQRMQGMLYKQAPPSGMLPQQPGTGGPHSSIGSGNLPTRTPPQHGSGVRSGNRHPGGGPTKVEDKVLSQGFDSSGGGCKHDPIKRARAQPPRQPRVERTPYQFFELGVDEESLMAMNAANPAAIYFELPEVMLDLWTNMASEQRVPFLNMATKDRERFLKEVADYENWQCATEAEVEGEVSALSMRSGGSVGGTLMLSPQHHAGGSHSGGPPVLSPAQGGGGSRDNRRDHPHSITQPMSPGENGRGRDGGGRQVHMGIPIGSSPSSHMMHRGPHPHHVGAVGGQAVGMMPAAALGGMSMRHLASGVRATSMVLGMPSEMDPDGLEQMRHMRHGMVPTALLGDHMMHQHQHHMHSPQGDGRMPGLSQMYHSAPMLGQHEHQLHLDPELDDGSHLDPIQEGPFLGPVNEEPFLDSARDGPADDDFAIAMNVLRCAQPGRGTAVPIDLFGCNAQVLVGADEAEADLKDPDAVDGQQAAGAAAAGASAAVRAGPGGYNTRSGPLRQVSRPGQLLTLPSPGSPLDAHVPHVAHLGNPAFEAPLTGSGGGAADGDYNPLFVHQNGPFDYPSAVGPRLDPLSQAFM